MSPGKSDCEVRWTPGPAPLQLRLHSRVGALFGRAITAVVLETAAACGVSDGTLDVDDNGALDFALRARTEACLRAAGCAAARHLGGAGVPAPPAASGSGRASAAVAVPPDGLLQQRRRRTRLYIPGDQPDLLPNAGLFGADCLVLDLEDSVAPARKEAARILLRQALSAGFPAPAVLGAAAQSAPGGPELLVRINGYPAADGQADLAELAACLPDGIVLPKCERPDQVSALATALDALEAAAGLPPGRIAIIPLVETARGVLAAPALASASPRVSALSFGAEDFCRDIGARRSATGSETLLARQAVVLAAKAAGVQAFDSVYAATDDEQGFLAFCVSARALGFDGVGALHPRQVGLAHRAFAPAPEELAEAQAVVAALERAVAAGRGVASHDGRMVDAPVAARARMVLAMAMQGGQNGPVA